ncbi:hypothetical protein AB0B63_18460 [Micromonospora sp. NPDC049081]|uniref:hypothetical protein n=1 Tax=Micromonospora sp. NPDC049081 TaxID=3155150 RepID=UPI0034104DD0
MAGRTAAPDTTNYRQRTLDYLDMMVPFEIIAQSRLHPEQRAQQARTGYLTVLDCGPTGRGKEQYSGFAALMYGGSTYESERRAFTTALAAMAYQPGGVTWMGRHWCVDHAECVDADRRAAELPPLHERDPEPEPSSGPTYRGRTILDVHLPEVS